MRATERGVVEESTLLESSSVTARRQAAGEALNRDAAATSVELFGASHDVLDVRGRTVVTPVVAYFGEVGERVRGRKDVAAISLSTVMSLRASPPTAAPGVKFIGTLEAEGLSGYEASALHGALRVVAGRNRAYKRRCTTNSRRNTREERRRRHTSRVCSIRAARRATANTPWADHRPIYFTTH